MQTLLLAIGIPAVGCGLVALGVYFGRRSLDWDREGAL